ncbi:MAG: mechanosensitive ion channel family protein [archaeon]
MGGILDTLKVFVNIVPFLKTILILAIIFALFSLIIKIIEKRLLKRVKTKKQITTVEIFSKSLKYGFLLMLILLAVFSYSGSWTSLGLVIGLLSAALGWALQRPISGIAAWIMVVTKRPFEIGDRIIIGSVRGDVSDITLTHIYLKELGGLIQSEENSGRIIMVPNSQLFEQNIINYTANDDYVLDQVVTLITYESNLDKAMQIALDATIKHTKEFKDQTKHQPHIRTYFQPSGINIHARYFTPATRVSEISSRITKEIFDGIRKTRGVEIAYPHIVYKKG